MTGQAWQLAAFLLTAWLLAAAVDHCYRRNERGGDDGVDAGTMATAPAPSPLPATPAPVPVPVPVSAPGPPAPPSLPARTARAVEPVGGVPIGS